MPFEEPGLLLKRVPDEHSPFRTKRARRITTALTRLMRTGWSFSAWLDFLKQPDESYAAEAEQCDEAEDVDEGPEEGLPADLLVDLGLRSDVSGGWPEPVAEEPGDGGGLLLEPVAGARDAGRDAVLGKVGAAGKQGLSD